VGSVERRTLVIGVEHGDVARAYPFDVVDREGVVNDEVDGFPVVVTATADGSLAAYERTVDGESVQFEDGDDHHLLGAGSRWKRATGRAVDGPHRGTRLQRATDDPPMFWNGWSNFHPDTELYGRDRPDTAADDDRQCPGVAPTG